MGRREDRDDQHGPADYSSNSLGARKRTRIDLVYDAIEDGIIQGRWRSGDRIDDGLLAQELGVSRQSVRVALAHFAENRIIEQHYWKGYRLRSFDWQEIEGLIEVRLVMESLAVEKVMATDISPALIRDLESAIEQSWQDLSANDYLAFRQSDFNFHEQLYEASGNVWLADIIGKLRLIIDLVRGISQVHNLYEVGKASIEEHTSIVEAIESTDRDAAVSRMRDHIRRHQERVRREFQHSAFGRQ